MSQRIETRRHARRAASKEALKQLQLLTAADDDDSTETYEITSDEDVCQPVILNDELLPKITKTNTLL